MAAPSGIPLLADYLQKVDGSQNPNPVNPQAPVAAPATAPIAPIAVAPVAPAAAPVQQAAPPSAPVDTSALDQLQNSDPVDLGSPPVKQKTYLQQVSGPFGTKGTLGSILGHVGDIILANAGLKPEYQPKVQAAKEADAISDFASNPSAAMARLASVAGAEKAAQFRDNYILGSQRILQSAKTQADLDLAAKIDPLKIAAEGQKVMPRAYSLANAIPDNASRATIQQGYDQVSRYLDQYHLPNNLPDISKLPDADAVAAMKNWAVQGVDVKDQISEARQSAKDAREGKVADTKLSIQEMLAKNTLRNTDSEIGYRGTMAGIAGRNADTAETNSGINQQRADDTAGNFASEADYRKWQMANPTKNRRPRLGGGGATPPVSPADFKGKTIKAPDGTSWTSDGTKWSK